MTNVWETLKKYFVEIVVLLIALATAIISLTLYLKSSSQEVQELSQKTSTPQTSSTAPAKILVDVEGSVNKPDLYEASNTSRLKDLIEKAGGLSDSADKDFFARNFNLAGFVTDQEKVYVPSFWEVSNGYFVDDPQAVTYSDQGTFVTNDRQADNKININKATIEELDTLPGVGKAIGQKIIDKRPFKALQELIDNNITSKNLFEKIKDLITI